MARAPDRFAQDPQFLGRIKIEHQPDGVVDVYYTPSEEAYRASTPEEDRQAALPRHRIARFDQPNRTISTWPIYVTIGAKFMEPRYERITEIRFEGYRFDLPYDAEEAAEQLDVIPEAFNTDFRYGLGAMLRDRPILNTVSALPKTNVFCVTTERATRWQAPVFYAAADEVDELHSFFQRIANRYTRRSLVEREVLAHNRLLHGSDPGTFPQKKPPYAPDAIFEFLSVAPGSKHKLSRNDRTALVSEIGNRSRELLEEDPARLFRLQRNIEVVNLDLLIERFTALLEQRSASEARWQALLQLNPFILNMLFGHAIVEVRGQATVSGPMADGRGARIADFLMRNPTSNGAALVELKLPKTQLLRKSPYRGREGARPVHAPTAELSGAVAQVLDQRHNLKEEIAYFQKKNRSDLEAFGVDCVVLAGRSPEDPDRIKDFELYRANLKDVRVVTFDEVLTSLRGLRDLLASEPIAIPSDPTDEEVEQLGDLEAEEGDEAGVDDEEEDEDEDDAW